MDWCSVGQKQIVYIARINSIICLVFELYTNTWVLWHFYYMLYFNKVKIPLRTISDLFLSLFNVLCVRKKDFWKGCRLTCCNHVISHMAFQNSSVLLSLFFFILRTLWRGYRQSQSHGFQSQVYLKYKILFFLHTVATSRQTQRCQHRAGVMMWSCLWTLQTMIWSAPYAKGSSNVQ